MKSRFTTFQRLYSIKPGVKLLKTTIRSIRFFYKFADISVFRLILKIVKLAVFFLSRLISTDGFLATHVNARKF